jgi:hypothetical protein
MEPLVLRKTSEAISPVNLFPANDRNVKRLKSLTPDTKMSFHKIEQVRDYYLSLAENDPKLQTTRKTKIKGLEDLGIFSEFNHSKMIYSENIKTHSPRTIHITDFMRKDQKMKLLQLAGQCKAYESKKEAYKKELFGRKLVYKNFFTYSEKNPGFFNTPQVSPRSLKDSDRKDMNNKGFSDKTLKLDKIINKCNEIISGNRKQNLMSFKV